MKAGADACTDEAYGSVLPGLIDVAADLLACLPRPELLAIGDAVLSGSGLLVWRIEAQQDVASVRLQLVHLDGRHMQLDARNVPVQLDRALQLAYSKSTPPADLVGTDAAPVRPTRVNKENHS